MLSNEFIYRLINVNYIRYTYIFITTREKRKETYTKKGKHQFSDRCYGGLSPDLQGMEQIRRLMRPTDVPDTGLLCDLLWSDPDKDVQGWGENDRGVSFTFGVDVVSKFLNRHELDLICRAHQVSLE